MAYAIVEAGGKQFRVEPGRFYDINHLHAEEDETVTLDRVLFVSSDAGIEVGQPLIEGATVSGTIMRHLRGPKIIVYKMRPKKKTRKKRGHRQELTRLMIDSISVGGSVISLDDAEAEEATETSEAGVETAAVEAPGAEAPVVEAATAEAEGTADAEDKAAPVADSEPSVEEATEDAQ